MSFSRFVNGVQKTIRDNSPVILTALGVSGVVTTGYLAAKAGWQSQHRVAQDPCDDLTAREKAELVWDLYIPAVTAGVITIGCIVCATHVSSKRVAAAYSILTVSEKAFDEYREKVVEQIGERKEQAVRDEIAQDHISKNPPGNLVVAGSGSVLCCELFTGRYFNCDMETLRKAANDINAKLVGEMYATLSDFYYLVGLPQTSNSGGIGWESSKLMNLEFSTVMSGDNRPCIAFEYNYTKPV